MHAHYLDPYRPGRSVIHALDARVKFILALAFILAAALTPSGAWPAFLLLLAALAATIILSEVGFRYVITRAALALPFVLAALPILFTLPGRTVWELRAGGLHLNITAEALEWFVSIAVRSWLSVQMAILLAATTPFHELLGAMRAVRIPRLLVAVVGLMWRYLFVLADEALRLMRARDARSGSAVGARSGGSLAWRAKVTGGMAGSLFLRSFDRADRIYAAMTARGYDGEVRGLVALPIRARQRAVLIAGLLSLAILTLLTRLL